MANKAVKRLYFDIEVSPNLVYSWSVGHKISLDYNSIVKERAVICICYKWEGDSTVHSLQWDAKQNDKRMLKEFVEVANEADELVGHNGDSFDLKWIRTRCAYHGIPMFPKYTTLDTLKKARGGFRFNSNRLDYIAKYFGVGKKIKTSFSLWKDVMNDDDTAMTQMIRYCKMDVKVLEAVYKKLSPYITNHVHHGALAQKEKYTCPECGGNHTTVSKRRVTASGVIKVQMQCQNKTCGKYFTINQATYNKMIEA